MNKILYVALNRAEGPTAECGALVIHEDVMPVPTGHEADRHFKGARVVACQEGEIATAVRYKLESWGRTAPEAGGGYDKVDFEVAWEGGGKYTGRFDMQRGGKDGGLDFWASLKRRLEFYSLRRRPSHFKDEGNWAHFCKQTREDGGDKQCADILDGCVLPD